MHKRIARQITINKSRASPDSLKSKPQQHIALAIAAVKGNDLIPLDSQIIHKPIANSLNLQVELLISLLRPFELQEHMIRSVLFCPPFQDVVVEQLVLGLLLGDECEGLCGSIVQVADFEIVADVELCVHVGCCCSDAGYGGNCRYLGYVSRELYAVYLGCHRI